MVAHETREIAKSSWLSFFDSISSSLQGKAVDITLSSSEGTVHQSQAWQLHGLTYDPHDDALIISCRQQEHVISEPKTIRVDKTGMTVNAVEVTKGVNDREIIRFIDPLLLNAV